MTRKLTSGVARILAGRASSLRLGNLDASRDWGHAREYVEAMWLMLQQDEPNDYVIATGETHSVRDFAKLAFAIAGLDYEKHLVIDSNLYRASEAVLLVGDATKARTELGWAPRTRFEDLVREMVENDCELLGLRIAAQA